MVSTDSPNDPQIDIASNPTPNPTPAPRQYVNVQ